MMATERGSIMTDELTDDELTPEERARIEREEAEGRAELQSYLDAGWRLEDGKLVHPTDNDVWIITDPMSGEETFSAKYVELLRAARRERLANGREEDDGEA
jgi:hypothetical protein